MILKFDRISGTAPVIRLHEPREIQRQRSHAKSVKLKKSKA